MIQIATNFFNSIDDDHKINQPILPFEYMGNGSK